MSEKRAKLAGTAAPLTGVDLSIPIAEGEFIHMHVAHGGELPMETEDGRKVPAAWRDGLLAQSDVWTEYNRATADKSKSKDESGS
jgi:hypothetical protein